MKTSRSKYTRGTSPAQTYLKLIRDQVAAVRRDMPSLTELGGRMAAPLLEGGTIFPAAVAEFWPSEYGGRAGGFMALGGRGHRQRNSARRDVAFFATPDPRRWDAGADANLQALLKSKAQLFVIGRKQDVAGAGNARRFAGFTGGADPDEGLYGLDGLRPLAPVRQFNQLVRGWITTGELIGACTRAGKMPAVYMSVWLEGSMVRNASLIENNNLREPRRVPFFHDRYYVPPLPEGHAGGEFLKTAEGILEVLSRQSAALARAGEWLAQAKRQGKRTFCVAVGHSYPVILERPDEATYPLEWGRSISDLRRSLPKDLGKGDVAVHLGYSPVDVADVRSILDRGIRFIYTSPYGRPAALKDHENLIWFDLPWRPGDATVDVPGYSVRVLPMSSTAHTMAYFAILCELAARMDWK